MQENLSGERVFSLIYLCLAALFIYKASVRIDFVFEL